MRYASLAQSPSSFMVVKPLDIAPKTPNDTLGMTKVEKSLSVNSHKVYTKLNALLQLDTCVVLV